VAVVDADAVHAGRFATDEALLAAQRAADPNLDHDSPLEELYEDQLACADLVVLTKTDLLDAVAAEAVEREVAAQVRPGVGRLHARHGEVPPAVLLGLGAAAEDDIAARPSHHDNEADHDHDDFDSFWVELPPAATPAGLIERLKSVALKHGILRLKGFAAIEGKPMRLVVQGVGERFGHYFDRAWLADERAVGRLVVIGMKGLDKAAITADLLAA
jgi:cobalamin biosynthesis protein CobW